MKHQALCRIAFALRLVASTTAMGNEIALIEE